MKAKSYKKKVKRIIEYSTDKAKWRSRKEEEVVCIIIFFIIQKNVIKSLIDKFSWANRILN